MYYSVAGGRLRPRGPRSIGGGARALGERHGGVVELDEMELPGRTAGDLGRRLRLTDRPDELLLLGSPVGERRFERVDLVAGRRDAGRLAEVEERQRSGDGDEHEEWPDVDHGDGSRRPSRTAPTGGLRAGPRPWPAPAQEPRAGCGSRADDRHAAVPRRSGRVRAAAGRGERGRGLEVETFLDLDGRDLVAEPVGLLARGMRPAFSDVALAGRGHASPARLVAGTSLGHRYPPPARLRRASRRRAALRCARDDSAGPPPCPG